MTARRARSLGRRTAARAPRARRRRWHTARRRLGAAVLVLAVGAGGAALWRVRPLDIAPRSRVEPRHADTPLSADARAWLVEHREEVRTVAATFEVSPVALGGIVAAEKTFLTGPMDTLGEEMFGMMLGARGEADLARWAEGQERAYQERLARGGGRPTILTPYLWTLGPAQVSLRLAIRYEPEAARRVGRPERSVKEVVDAVGTASGNLEYAAALLADAERAYAEVAGVDIAGDPGLLATLYHVGSPTWRARRRAAEQALREREGAPLGPPRTNWYGAFVNRHAAEIADLLAAPAPASAEGSARSRS